MKKFDAAVSDGLRSFFWNMVRKEFFVATKGLESSSSLIYSVEHMFGMSSRLTALVSENLEYEYVHVLFLLCYQYKDDDASSANAHFFSITSYNVKLEPILL